MWSWRSPEDRQGPVPRCWRRPYIAVPRNDLPPRQFDGSTGWFADCSCGRPGDGAVSPSPPTPVTPCATAGVMGRRPFPAPRNSHADEPRIRLSCTSQASSAGGASLRPAPLMFWPSFCPVAPPMAAGQSFAARRRPRVATARRGPAGGGGCDRARRCRAGRAPSPRRTSADHPGPVVVLAGRVLGHRLGALLVRRTNRSSGGGEGGGQGRMPGMSGHRRLLRSRVCDQPAGRHVESQDRGGATHPAPGPAGPTTSCAQAPRGVAPLRPCGRASRPRRRSGSQSAGNGPDCGPGGPGSASPCRDSPAWVTVGRSAS